MEKDDYLLENFTYLGCKYITRLQSGLKAFKYIAKAKLNKE